MSELNKFWTASDFDVFWLLIILQSLCQRTMRCRIVSKYDKMAVFCSRGSVVPLFAKILHIFSC